MTVAYLLKHDTFGSNFVLLIIKQNLPNSIILPPKNGGFKARSHSVRILYLKLKLSTQKTTFVLREHEIYRQITAFIVVFDAAGDSSTED